MVLEEMATVPPWTKTPPPDVAVFPLMVLDEIATVPPPTSTPPPSCPCPCFPAPAEFPLMVHDEIVTEGCDKSTDDDRGPQSAQSVPRLHNE